MGCTLQRRPLREWSRLRDGTGSGNAKPKEAAHRDVDYSTTLISGTRGVKNGVKGCPKRHLLHRVDHVTVSRFFLACAVKCHEFCSPPPTYPLFYHFCRPKISQAQNGSPRLTRLVFRRRLPVQYIARTASTTNMDRLPTSCSPLPYCSTPIGHTTFSHNLLSII
jgi:hypothetical protein